MMIYHTFVFYFELQACINWIYAQIILYSALFFTHCFTQTLIKMGIEYFKKGSKTVVITLLLLLFRAFHVIPSFSPGSTFSAPFF